MILSIKSFSDKKHNLKSDVRCLNITVWCLIYYGDVYENAALFDL